MRVIKNMLVPMDDGVRIAADIYLPAAERRYPAVFYFGPYRKEDWILHGSMSGLPETYTNREYVLVIADVRGTNDSEGIASDMFTAREQRDGYQLVEWIAAQPWCDGNVGMTGISYGFFTSVSTAALQPPHLRTIVPIHGSASWFYCIHEGGLPMSFGYHSNYVALMISMQGLPPGYRSEKWRLLWRNRLETLCPWGLDWWGLLADDEHYDDASLNRRYSRIKVPVFAIDGWWDRYASEPLLLRENLQTSVKMLIGPWQHARMDTAVPGPRIDYDVVLRWFDYWLKAEKNGVMEEPRLLYYAQRYAPPARYRACIPGEWREADDWPPPGLTISRWYLRRGGSLRREATMDPGSDTYQYDPSAGACSGLSGGIYGGVGMPVDQRPDEEKSLVYSTPSLQQETEVTGMPRVLLRFSSSARVMAVIVKLCDVAPDGTIALVTRGYLNVCHRYGLADPCELTPGEVYDLSISMKATSYVFEPGHHIRLAITSAEFPSLWATREPGTNRIYYEGSELELPTLPSGSSRPAVLRPAQSDAPESPPDGRRYQVTSDPETGERIAELRVNTRSPGFGYTVTHRHDTVARVHADRPERSMVESRSSFRFDYESGECIESHGEVRCTGTFSAVKVEASLRVTENGLQTFSRHWTAEHPREYI